MQMDDLWRMPVSADGSLGGKWQRVWPGGGGGMDSPGPRSGHRMLALGDKLLIYGGMGESKYYGDLHVWDVSRGVWISKAVKMQQMKLFGDKAPTPVDTLSLTHTTHTLMHTHTHTHTHTILTRISNPINPL